MRFLGLLLILLPLIFISCGEDEKEEKDTCAITNPLGTCVDENEVCYKGQCISANLECEQDQRDAPCSNSSLDCVFHEDQYLCVDEGSLCGVRNLSGVCLNSDEVCISGVCTKYCSQENLDGPCEDDTQICDSGVCKFNCSSDHPNSDSHCPDSAQTCFEGSCQNPCSEEHTDGFCTDNMRCIDGGCKHLCSPQNPNEDSVCLNDEGDQDPEKVCNNGACIYRCSEAHPETQSYCADEQVCKEGTCVYYCSAVHPELESYCLNSEEVCVEGTCIPVCSETSPEMGNYCEEDNKVCVDGSCIFECSLDHPENTNYCAVEGHECIEGVCDFRCSAEYPDYDNHCNNEDHRCFHGVCNYPCDSTHSTGSCLDQEQGCFADSENGYSCQYECSAEHPEITNYCPTGKLCYDGECKYPCSAQYQDGYCENDMICDGGTCKYDCSLEHPGSDSFCDNDQICVLGECNEPCAYERPYGDSGDNGSFGDCCRSHDHCGSGICAQMDDTKGGYCVDLETGCSQDSDCDDSHVTYKSDGVTVDYSKTSKYYCSQFTIWPEVSYCERVPSGCRSGDEYTHGERNVQLGEFCDEDECIHSECQQGAYCINGVCTNSCENDTGENYESTSCPFIGDEGSTNLNLDPALADCMNIDFDRADGVQRGKFCVNSCRGNRDCSDTSLECNKVLEMGIDNQYLKYSCSPKKSDGNEYKTTCEEQNHESCKTNVCNTNQNYCSKPCEDDFDCCKLTSSGWECESYCNFINKIEVNGVEQYMGVCQFYGSNTQDSSYQCVCDPLDNSIVVNDQLNDCEIMPNEMCKNSQTCTSPKTMCRTESEAPSCYCPDGRYEKEDGSCAYISSNSSPCGTNPCTEPNKTTCIPSERAGSTCSDSTECEAGETCYGDKCIQAECVCDQYHTEVGGVCVKTNPCMIDGVCGTPRTECRVVNGEATCHCPSGTYEEDINGSIRCTAATMNSCEKDHDEDPNNNLCPARAANEKFTYCVAKFENFEVINCEKDDDCTAVDNYCQAKFTNDSVEGVCAQRFTGVNARDYQNSCNGVNYLCKTNLCVPSSVETPDNLVCSTLCVSDSDCSGSLGDWVCRERVLREAIPSQNQPELRANICVPE